MENLKSMIAITLLVIIGIASANAADKRYEHDKHDSTGRQLLYEFAEVRPFYREVKVSMLPTSTVAAVIALNCPTIRVNT